MDYLKTFFIGGAICAIGQILIDRTKLTPARILVGFLTAGVILTFVGLYEPLVEFAGAGATVPISGFGYALAKATMKALDEKGLPGLFSGGLTGVSSGLCAAMLFGFITAAVTKPKMK